MELFYIDLYILDVCLYISYYVCSSFDVMMICDDIFMYVCDDDKYIVLSMCEKLKILLTYIL